MLSPEYLKTYNFKKVRTNTSLDGTKAYFLQYTHTTKQTENVAKEVCKMTRVIECNDHNNCYGVRETSVHTHSAVGYYPQTNALGPVIKLIKTAVEGGIKTPKHIQTYLKAIRQSNNPALPMCSSSQVM